jgi:thiol-disulfide isomerase/thioredoxin
MLNQKCFCLPLWVWLVAIGIAVYYYCYSKPKKTKLQIQPQPKPNEEKKEKFGNVTNSKLKIFNFNTEWCGWSQRFQPEWDNFTKAVKEDSNLNRKVEVFDIKCDQSSNERMCEEYKVPGYPYV